jgi:hypothetical protein
MEIIKEDGAWPQPWAKEPTLVAQIVNEFLLLGVYCLKICYSFCNSLSDNLEFPTTIHEMHYI